MTRTVLPLLTVTVEALAGAAQSIAAPNRAIPALTLFIVVEYLIAPSEKPMRDY